MKGSGHDHAPHNPADAICSDVEGGASIGARRRWRVGPCCVLLPRQAMTGDASHDGKSVNTLRRNHSDIVADVFAAGQDRARAGYPNSAYQKGDETNNKKMKDLARGVVSRTQKRIRLNQN